MNRSHRSRVNRRLWLLSVAGVAMAGVVWAAPAGKGSAPKLAEDARLQTALTVSAPGISLRELLPRLSSVTGAKLLPAPEVAEEKVILFGPPRPAWETLEDLAALLELRWERAGSAPGTYRLSRSPQATQRIVALQLATAQRLRVLVDEHAAALAETPEQLRQRTDRDVTRKILEEPEFRTATVFYSLLSDRQKEELFARKQLRFPLEALTPQLQAPLRDIYTRRVQQEEQFYQSPEGLESIRQASQQGGTVQRRRMEDLERNSFRMEALRADGTISVGVNLGALPTAASVTVEENGRQSIATSSWPVTLVDTAKLWIFPPHGNPYQPAPIDPIAAERFGRALSERKAGGDWIEQLQALASATGKRVLADYYRGRQINHSSMGESVAGPATTVEQRLDRFCAPAQYLWWTRGSSLLLRKRDWYDQRAYEPTDSWLERSAAQLTAQNGAVSTADLPLISEPTPDQVAGLAALAQNQGVYDSGDGVVFQKLRTLAVGALRLQQKRLLPRTRGANGAGAIHLMLADLTLPQRRAIEEISLRMGWLLTPEELQAFQLQLSVGGSKTVGEVEYLPVRFQCQFGQAHQVTSTLHLPLGVPHDRRNQTVVEKTP